MHILPILVLSIVSSIEAVNPGTSVSAFGFTIETSSMIGRIEHKLRVRHSAGIALRFAQSNACLDSDFQAGSRWYSLYLNVCDQNKQSQRWRLVDGVLRVGQKPESHAAIEGDQACLSCWSQLSDCYLYVLGCTNTQAQRYFLRIHPGQIDLVKGRVYFSMHSSLYPDRCIAPYWAPSTSRTTNNFYLEDCQGLGRHSFYVDGLDFSKQIEAIRGKVVEQLNRVAQESTTIENEYTSMA